MKIVELLLFTVDVGNENPHRILDVLDGSEVGCCFWLLQKKDDGGECPLFVLKEGFPCAEE